MKSCLKYTAAALGLMLASTAASAADLPPPPAPMMPAAWSFSVFGAPAGSTISTPIQRARTSVSRAEAGILFRSDHNWRGEAQFDTGFLVGGTFGYTFVDWARTELEISYASYDLDKVDVRYRGCNEDCAFHEDAFGPRRPTSRQRRWQRRRVDHHGQHVARLQHAAGGRRSGEQRRHRARLLALLRRRYRCGLRRRVERRRVRHRRQPRRRLAWQVGAGVRWNFASNMGLDLVIVIAASATYARRPRRRLRPQRRTT